MVVNYSLGKKNLAEHEPANQHALNTLASAVPLLLALADEDAAAYGAVNELSRLPEGEPRRDAELPLAQRASVQVPMAVAAACVDLLRRFEHLSATTNRHLRSDLAIAAIFADAGTRASACNVAVNLPSLPTAEADKARAECNALLAESARLYALVERACAA
jgi:formiminotetrahydrofolate cyclodeaminase